MKCARCARCTRGVCLRVLLLAFGLGCALVASSVEAPVFDIYRYDTGIWGFIDSFRVVLVNGMRKWYASY